MHTRDNVFFDDLVIVVVNIYQKVRSEKQSISSFLMKSVASNKFFPVWIFCTYTCFSIFLYTVRVDVEVKACNSVEVANTKVFDFFFLFVVDLVESKTIITNCRFDLVIELCFSRIITVVVSCLILSVSKFLYWNLE